MAYGSELSAWAAVPFIDAEETAQAFRNPLYSTSEAFRDALASKLSISGDAVGLQGHSNIKANVINVYDPRSPNTIPELSPEEAASFSTVASPEDLQEYADLMGAENPLALNPELKITPRARQTQQETPKPSLFDDGKLMQMRKEQKDREAASA